MERLYHANLRPTKMVLARDTHIFNSRQKKRLIRQWKPWMQKRLEVRKSRSINMKRRHPEITRSRVNSTTYSSRIYPRVPMMTS